jgi:hypothetical protein
MKLKIILTALALCFSTTTSIASDKTDKNKVDTAAVKIVVEKWLDLVDSGAYEKSWKESSELFRAKVKQTEWKDQVEKARAPLGIARRPRWALCDLPIPHHLRKQEGCDRDDHPSSRQRQALAGLWLHHPLNKRSPAPYFK